MLDAGSYEGFKALWHIALLVLVTGCWAYNTLAYLKRGEGQLLAGVWIYGALVTFEVCVIISHLEVME